MRVELGDHVFSQDGQDLGTIKHLILNPDDRRVKTVVVEKGLLLHNDIEVPLDALQSADEARGGQVYIAYTSEQARSLPHFDITQYTPVPAQDTELGAYPTGGLLWGGGYVAQPFAGAGYPMGAGVLPFAAPLMAYGGDMNEMVGQANEQSLEVREYRRHEDETNAIISEGDQVLSRDGETVGAVHSIVVDTVSGKPTALVVRKGLLFTHDTTLLADSIASVDDGVVTLTLDKSQLSA